MSYSGNPANYPASFAQPSDGTPPTASAVNVPDEALGDRTAYLKARVDAIQAAPVSFSSSGTWVCPTYCTRVLIEACGGGGGGGGGANGGTDIDHSSMGGGGGGGALKHWEVRSVVPGTTYEITIGAGGTGGAGGASNADGGDGGDTIFGIEGVGELARWKGAKGGRKGSQIVNPAFIGMVPGGAPIRTMRRPAVRNFEAGSTTPENETLVYGPGFGGEGVTSGFTTDTRPGADSIEGYAGGAAGAQGTHPGGGAYPPGGAGGGGAAGPYGDGVAGKGGGAGSTGTGGDAEGGGSSGSGTGAGGGGGGGGGSGPTAGGLGSDAHAGHSGALTIRCIG